MTRRRKGHPNKPDLGRKPIDAIESDPLRRAMTFVVALSVFAAALIISDAIEFERKRAAQSTPPMIVGITAMMDQPGNPKDKDRGEQKVKPEETRPKNEPPREPEKPTDEPPAPKVVSDKPAGPATVPNPGDRTAVIAVPGGTGSSSGGGSPYSNRGGGAREASLGIYGGNAQTESAVRLGLQWLVRHQDENGSWSRTEFNAHCIPGEPRCSTGVPAEYSKTVLEPGITGLALLCFAASDNTHKKGEYQRTVAAGVRYLCETQAASGCFGDIAPNLNYYMMYNHGIATFALAELCAMTGDAELKPHVQKAVDFIVRAQQPSGGWDYKDLKLGRYDTSVTGWQIMALKSAQAAGIGIPSQTLYKAAEFIDNVTLPTGEVIYANLDPSPGRRGHGMVAVGMASAQFLGFPVESDIAKRQTAILLENPPNWSKLASQSVERTTFDSIYYWYYATMAMFQVGGKPWDTWNAALQKQLLVQQRRGGCLDGSWDPPRNFWGVMGGRMYSTTLNILNLEIYYRYLPIHDGGKLRTVEAIIDVIDSARRKQGGSGAAQAVRLLGRFDDPKAREYLVALAHGDDPALAMEASIALADRRDRAAVAPLLLQLKSQNQFARYRAVRALSPMIAQGLVPVFIDCLRDDKPTVAREADKALQVFANVSFGFEAEAPLAEREAAIKKWQEWWLAQQRNTAAPESAPVWLVVKVAPERSLVVFNTGTPGQTEQGKKYSVFRNSAYVGRIDVLQVDGAMCIGKVLDQFKAGEIREGDVVRPGT